MSGDDPVMVANPYKAAVGRAVGRARPVAAECGTAFDAAIAAMKGKCWVSPTADMFFAALIANDTDAGNAGNDCVTALQQTFDDCPDKVVAGSPDTKWQRMY